MHRINPAPPPLARFINLPCWILKNNIMNKQLRNIGIGTLVAGALVYPAIKLYQYIAKRRAGMAGDEGEEEKAPKKKMHMLHKNKHTPHHMAHMSAQNGHANPSVG